MGLGSMIRGTAEWSYDPQVRGWYIKLDERAKPPYRDNRSVHAILDLDSEGRLAGIEFFDAIEPPVNAK